MTVPENLKLETAKKAAKAKVFRASDFLSNEEAAEVRKANAEGKKDRRAFDEIDAYMAEILARFGYEAYMAWQAGTISGDKMARMVMAERAREKRNLLGLEGIILAGLVGANNPTKGGHAPKSLKSAIKILKREQEIAKGGK